MDANNLSSISQGDTDEKMGEFWDSHDFTDFDDPNTPDVNFEISCAVPVEVELLAALEKQAHKRGIQVETLVNLWLQQKLDEQKEKSAA
ncbi:MAG: BrnA antitoxin family protein [Anaerolineae bacterium]|nr:BrnA antitoxin family protein [Anaerolineae bacterium]